MIKKLMLMLIVISALFLVGCAKDNDVKTVNVKVVDGFDLDVIQDDKAIKEFYVIVHIVDDDPDKLFQVKVPVKNRFAGVNSVLNYPKGSILNVNEKDLRWYAKITEGAK